MTRVITRAAAFKKDYKRMQKRGYVMERLIRIIRFLAEGKNLKSGIAIIPCMEIMRDTGNATLNLIGC